MQRLERAQESDQQITDWYYIQKSVSDNAAKEARKSTRVAMISLWATILGTVIAIIALFK